MTPATPESSGLATREGPSAAATGPVAVLRALLGLRRFVGLYPAGHPAILERLDELEGLLQEELSSGGTLQLDSIHGRLHRNMMPIPEEGRGHGELTRELGELGLTSIEFRPGIDRAQLARLAQLLWECREGFDGRPVSDRLAELGVVDVTLARVIPLDTRWSVRRWDDGPSGTLDPAYEESLAMAQDTFAQVAAGQALDPATVRDLVRLLIHQVAHSSAAMAQILAVKQYENLTYCHSVNVAMLSHLLGRQLGMDDTGMAALVECALLHDLGKTRVPLEIVQKPGALDRRERALIEDHTTFGAELLVQAQGVHPLAPTVALEHHRHPGGGGYPALGEGVVPHLVSQIVSVADVYEALTGARSYKEPHRPERAMLILARIAGEQLNASMVKAFISAVSFFPVGSVVRTSEGTLALVVRTNPADPLHPVVRLLSEDLGEMRQEVDTSERDAGGAYRWHVLDTLGPDEAPPERLQPLIVAA